MYEEKQNVSYPLVTGILLLALAVGLIPGIIFGGLWWLTAIYIGVTLGITVSFFQMKIELSEDKLLIRYGIFYRKNIEREKMLTCSPCEICNAMKTYGGWGIRRGRDGTFALTQAFLKKGIRLQTVEKTFVISSQNPEAFSESISSVMGKYKEEK